MNYLKRLSPFFDFNLKNKLDVISISVGILVFAVIVLRAICVDIQYDEAYTYLNTGRIQNVWSVYLFRIANTHLLNSLAMAVTTMAFPYNDFMIRLPNLLTALFYIAVSISISKQYKNRFLLLALLLFNHFMIDFMAQGRGYGMSASFLLASFFVLKNQAKFSKPYSWIAILLLLAFYANYVAIFPASMLAMYIWMYRLKFKRPPFSKKERYWFSGLTLLGIYGFFSVTREGKPLYGSATNDFFKSIPIDFVERFSPNFHLSNSLITFIAIALALAIVLFWFKKKETVAGMILICSLACIVFLALLSGKPLPTGRVLLPFWPVVALAIVEVLELITFKKSNLIVPAFSLIFAILLGYVFLEQVHPSELIFSKKLQWKRSILALQNPSELRDPDEQYYLEKDFKHDISKAHLAEIDATTTEYENYILRSYAQLALVEINFKRAIDLEALSTSFYANNELVRSSKIETVPYSSEFEMRLVYPSDSIDKALIVENDSVLIATINRY